MNYYTGVSQSFPDNGERSEPYLFPSFYSAPTQNQQTGLPDTRNYFPNDRQWPIQGPAGSGALQPRVQRIVGWSDSTFHRINPASTNSRVSSHYAPTYPLVSSNGITLQRLPQAYDFTNTVQTDVPINHFPNPNVPQNEMQSDMTMDVMFDANCIRTPLPLMGGPVTINSPNNPPFGDPYHPQVQFPAMNFNISNAINIGVPLEPQLIMPVEVETFALDDGPQIHERFNKSRAIQTSGDPSIGKSMLFESEVPTKRLGVPYMEGHWGTGFVQRQPIIPISEADEEEPPMNELEREAIASAAQLAQQGASIADQGIKQFCERSFPHSPELQEKLRKMMPFEVTQMKKDRLAEFLQEVFCTGAEDGKEKRWKCLFSGPCGPCTAVIKRRDGAIGHILEKHLHVMPIECKGECGEPKCTLRFATTAMKSNHTRTNTQITCNLCGRSTSARNICRHQKTSICRQGAARLARPAGLSN